jgi:hypothetical protein
VEGWKDGRMEGWKDGRMEGWKDGRMEATRYGEATGRAKLPRQSHNMDLSV